MEQVSQSLQNALKSKRWKVNQVESGRDSVRIVAATAAREHASFTVVLKEVKTSSGSQTRIRLEGDQKSDPQVVQLVAEIEQASRKARS